MSLVFSCGTAAELIKLYPVLTRAEKSGKPWAMLFTGQSPESCVNQWDDFGLPPNRLARLHVQDHDLARPRDAARWFAVSMARRASTLRALLGRSGIAPGVWVVHGDTLSTFLGAVYGRRLGFTVAHVEAGLRSHNLTDPFPEEIARRGVAAIAKMHFCPEPDATENLRRERTSGLIVETAGNTQLDAIDDALLRAKPSDMPNGDYALVNIHRFETLVSSERKAAVKETLLKASESMRLIVVSHATTMDWLSREEEFQRALEKNGTTWLPRQPFTRFAHWLANAHHLISDSGGNQEECAYLGVPCLLLRHVTERALPKTRKCIVLSKFEPSAIDAFLANPAAYREPREVRDVKPADQIWAALASAAA